MPRLKYPRLGYYPSSGAAAAHKKPAYRLRERLGVRVARAGAARYGGKITLAAAGRKARGAAARLTLDQLQGTAYHRSPDVDRDEHQAVPVFTMAMPRR